MSQASVSQQSSKDSLTSEARIATGGSPARQESVGAGIASAGTASAGMPSRPPILQQNSKVSSTSEARIATGGSPARQETGLSRDSQSPQTRISQQNSHASPTSGLKNAAGGSSSRNSPEIYTRHSESDIPPLQSPSLNRENKPHSSSNYGAKEGTGSSGQRPPTDKNRDKRGKRGDRA